jgi:integrase
VGLVSILLVTRLRSRLRTCFVVGLLRLGDLGFHLVDVAPDDELLEERDELPIAHLTPHTLRRTSASLCAEIGVQPRRAMYLLGHTNPKFTVAVYQQVLDLGDGDYRDFLGSG